MFNGIHNWSARWHSERRGAFAHRLTFDDCKFAGLRHSMDTNSRLCMHCVPVDPPQVCMSIDSESHAPTSQT